MDFVDSSGGRQVLYQIKLGFHSASDLHLYEADMEAFRAWRAKKSAPKKAGDKRGAHVKDLHARARAFREANPTLTYRESLKLVGRRDDEDEESEFVDEYVDLDEEDDK
jgi:hypothetical protein